MSRDTDFPSILDQVEKAVVNISKKKGQGILVDNYNIITAAHCITWECEGDMAMGGFYIEDIEMGGKRLKVGPIVVEPVSDIAVLGPLDSQSFLHEFDDFCNACNEILPVKLCTEEFELFQDIKAFVFTHDNGWIQVTAKQCRKNAQTLWIESKIQIAGGTSGGPVVNGNGELIGVVSTFSNAVGQIPRPHLALPVWIYNVILNGAMW